MSKGPPSVDALVYTIPEAAALLKVSTRNMYEIVRQGGFPVIQISPNRKVVPKAGLEAWLDKMTQQGA